MTGFTATALGGSLASGALSAETLAAQCLDRIADHDGTVRAFITVDAGGALKAARDSDERRAAGRGLGPLDGIPVAVKDNIDVRGLPVTDGTAFWAKRIAPDDAEVVRRLRAAGAVILGKLNMHEGALGATTDNPFWGRCDNPAAPGRTPGGSSGGSAAAVAAGFVPVAIGTDTMGSVRIPAAYCGLWAVKPTPGVIPTGGLRFLSRSLDTIGPIAATADDLRLACGIMAGLDLSPLLVPLRELVLGIPAEIREVDLAPAVGEAFDALVARLKRRGTTIRTVSVAGWEPGRLRRAGLLLAEAEAAEEFGADLDRGGAGFSDMFRALVDHGRRADPERLAAARARLATARSATAAALASVDALLMPTAPQKPFPHGAAVPANQADVTALANAAGLPAVAFPIPDMGEGVPASAQLLGAPNHEAGLLAIAEAVAGA